MIDPVTEVLTDTEKPLFPTLLTSDVFNNVLAVSLLIIVFAAIVLFSIHVSDLGDNKNENYRS